MKLSAVATSIVLTLTLSVCSGPAMAQHPNRGHAPAGHAVPQGHPGMGHVPPHIQMQIHQQQMQYQQHMQRMQQQAIQQAHQQYQKDLHQFNQWLKANGGASASRLPNNPADFDRSAQNQHQKKARGQSYDPLYDHYRAFAGSMTSSGSRHQGGGQASTSQSPAHGNAKHGQQPAAAGSMAGQSSTGQAAKKSQATGAAGSTTRQEKHAEHKREEARRRTPA